MIKDKYSLLKYRVIELLTSLNEYNNTNYKLMSIYILISNE